MSNSLKIIIPTENLKKLRIKWNFNPEMRVKIDLMLLERIGQDALEQFWKENNLLGKTENEEGGEDGKEND